MTTRFTPLSDQRLFFPVPTWHVDGWVPARHHTLMFGDKGSLKSFIALDLAYATATGLPTIFGPKPAEIGPAIYLTYTGEGIDGVRHQRTLAWELAHQLDVPHPDFVLLPGPRLKENDPEPYVEGLKDGLDGMKCPLVIVDTIFQATAGYLLVESGAHYTRFVDRVIERLGAAVVSLHHPPKDNPKREDRGKEKPTPYGAQDLTVNTPSLLYVERTGPTTTSIEQLHHKDAAENERPTYFKIEHVEQADSLILRPIPEQQHRFDVKINDAISKPMVAGALAAFAHPVTTETLAQSLVRLTGTGPNKEGRYTEIFGALVRAKRKGGSLEFYYVEGQWSLPIG